MLTVVPVAMQQPYNQALLHLPFAALLTINFRSLSSQALVLSCMCHLAVVVVRHLASTKLCVGYLVSDVLGKWWGP